MKLSVILCTHNPRIDYLERVLEALRHQTLARNLWELLVIDNASTLALESRIADTWHPKVRYIRELELGLTFARVRGIIESSAELLLFIDDDNVLAPDYMEVLLQLAADHSKLGCFGAGQLIPEFEEEPVSSLKPYTGMLALRTVSEAHWSNCPTDSFTPWGAGLAVRRSVAVGFVDVVQSGSFRKKLGRRGSRLNSGEDKVFSWVACKMGYGKGIFPELKIIHLIDSRRIQLDYLLSIAEGHAYSHTILNHLHGRKISELKHPPTFESAFSALLHGNVLGFLRLSYHLWKYLHSDPLKQAFDRATRQGFERAYRLISQNALNDTSSQVHVRLNI